MKVCYGWSSINGLASGRCWYVQDVFCHVIWEKFLIWDGMYIGTAAVAAFLLPLCQQSLGYINNNGDDASMDTSMVTSMDTSMDSLMDMSMDSSILLTSWAGVDRTAIGQQCPEQDWWH